MRQVSRSRVATMERRDLRVAEGIIAGSMLSLILWASVLFLLH